MHLDHINISGPVELLEELKSFYCDVFGLSEGYRPNFSRNGFWLYAGDKPLIHLTESASHYRNKLPGYLDHVAFRGEDPAPVQAALETLGVSYTKTRVPELGMIQLFFDDPAGNGLEINFIGAD